GLVTFGGAADLGSLKVMKGFAEIDGGSVTTAGTGAPLPGGVGNVGQYYHDDVVANGSHVTDVAGISDHNPLSLTDSSNGTITFVNQLNGAAPAQLATNLTIDTTNWTTFGQPVALGSLAVQGPAEIDGGAVATQGTATGTIGQFYHGDVVVNGP